MATGRADHYRAALLALEHQKADYLNQIKDLDGLIAGIARQIQLIEGPLAPSALGAEQMGVRLPMSADLDAFRGISVRWGILKFLGEIASTPMTSGEITRALEAGGMKSKAERFAGNVSAVLSVMKAEGREEVEVVGDGRYQLTQHGRQVWDHIKVSPKYRNRLSPNIS
jgi:hypothetical protein